MLLRYVLLVLGLMEYGFRVLLCFPEITAFEKEGMLCNVLFAEIVFISKSVILTILTAVVYA